MGEPTPLFDRVKHETAELEIRHLTTDPGTQRQLRQPKVDKIANSFNPAALGVIVASWRDITQDVIHVVDGQHRVAACRQVRYAGKVQALVYYGLTRPEEAAPFRMPNSGDKPAHADLFLTRCTEGDPVANACVDLLAQHGWQVLPGSVQPGAFSATGSLERAWTLDPEATKRAVRLLTEGFGRVQNALQGTLLLAMTMVLVRYGDRVRDEAMVKALKRQGLVGPDAIINNGRNLHRIEGGSVSKATAKIIVREYNGIVRGKIEPYA